jgi:hypothetical protein
LLFEYANFAARSLRNRYACGQESAAASLNTDLAEILEVRTRETARGFQDQVVCNQVVELLALGGATETMITSAVAQWHELLVRSSRAISKKA